eukprot:2732722-Pyramimonas_sp.AAC.1
MRADRFQTVALTWAPQHVVLAPRSFIPHQALRVGAIRDCLGAAVTLIRRVEVSGTMFWHDSGSPRRNNEIDSWR